MFVSSQQPRARHTPLARAMQGAVAALALGAGCLPVWAQQTTKTVKVDEAPLALKPGTSLIQEVPSVYRKQLPVFVWGEKVEGELDAVTVMEGNAELRRHDLTMRADRIEYDKRTGESKSTGNVILNRMGDRFTGPQVELNVNTHWGHFEKAEYSLLKNEGKGDASRVDFMGDKLSLVHDGRYSTCPRPPGSAWMPDWIVRAKTIELDQVEDIGIAKSGVVEFKGVPIVAAPILSFPLSDRRKTGALSPSMSISTDSGMGIEAPYYFNIAPNYDATVYPTLMSKRGLDVAGEFRYLEDDYTGRLRAAYMPSDQLRDLDRWAYSVLHTHQLTEPLAGGSPLGLRINLADVSDDNYWRDFSRSNMGLTSRLLHNEVSVGWRKTNWSMSVGAYRYHTLQSPDAPITPPFDRLPTLGFSYHPQNLTLFGAPGWDITVSSNLTRFERSPLSSSQKQGGDRGVVLAEISRRWQAPGWYVQPKLRVHSARYSNDNTTGANVSASRSAPSASLDSGLVFERPVRWLDTDYVQTLEPRAFVTWTPYRDQSQLPNYDSAQRDFNLSSMFTENAFSGNDRISDTKAVTLGLSSRLLDAGSGVELLRLGLAQRELLADQKVTVPGGKVLAKGMSDTLVAARAQWDPLWSLDSNVQYNFKTKESARTTIGGRYTPGSFRVLSAAYRRQKGVSEQLDLGWQWPLSGVMGETPEAVPGRALGPGQWYGVGRMLYSMRDNELVDVIAGFEYDAGCWLGRIVLERVQTSSTQTDRRIMFQLELNGFSRVGASSLQTLEANVPRYRHLREELPETNRFDQYD